MSDRSKKIFLLLTVIGSFMIYSVIYYAQVFKNAPYKFTEFKSFVFKYGYKDSLVNTYNSLTGDYQYLDKHDSLVKTHVFLTNGDLLYLHKKAADLGLWDFHSNELSSDTTKLNGTKPLYYYIEFNYKRKSKKVWFVQNYDGPEKLIDANEILIGEINKVIKDAEDRQKK